MEYTFLSRSDIPELGIDSYHDSVDRGLLLTRKLLKQGFLVVKLKSTLGRIYGLICVTEDYGYVPFVVITIRSFHQSVMTFHQVCINSSTKDVTCGAGTAYPSGTSKFTSVFSGVRVSRYLVFV